MFRPNPWVFALVAISLGLSWYFAAQGPVRANPRAECLTDGNCQSGERCVIVPKGDGFATFGQCGETCQDDSACANGWSCRAWVDEGKGFLSPERGHPADAPRVKVCQHKSVQ